MLFAELAKKQKHQEEQSEHLEEPAPARISFVVLNLRGLSQVPWQCVLFK
jgi:hypothetical protein